MVKSRRRTIRRKTVKRGGSYGFNFTSLGGNPEVTNTTDDASAPFGGRGGNNGLTGGRRRRRGRKARKTRRRMRGGAPADYSQQAPRTAYGFAGQQVAPGLAIHQEV